MTPELLRYLCEPVTYANLTLENARYDERGHIVDGVMVGTKGRYPIKDGVPRFVDPELQRSVSAFGDEWNYYNFTDFKLHWLRHTVASTFGSPDVFRDKLVVDAGGGSGAQTRWMLEAGARHVIMLELSHTVDGVARRNLEGISGWDMVQCSIDAPPIKPASIDGIVMCHNVIQHTPSVEATARALFDIVAPGGEFVFNCYGTNDGTPVRWIRFHMVYKPLRAVLSRVPFHARLAYSYGMAAARLVPGLGVFLEKSGFCVCGPIEYEGNALGRARRIFRVTSLNTFDSFGGHSYQHHKSEKELRKLIADLAPREVLNLDTCFLRPPPPGCAFRLKK